MPEHNTADNTVDTKCLLDWLQAARQEVAAIARTCRGEELIGEMFSAAPIGSDGLWPHEAVGDAIEAAASDGIEFDFEVGTAGKRSFTVRGFYDGGTQEREQRLDLPTLLDGWLAMASYGCGLAAFSRPLSPSC